MTVSQFAVLHGYDIQTMPDGEAEVSSGYAGDLLSWVMGRAQAGQVWITIMSNINIVAVASLTGVSCVLLAEGVKAGADVVEAATARGVNILSSEKTAYELAAEISRDDPGLRT